MESAEDRSSGAADSPELMTSARGWHGVQLAVLGFIGLCGVLNGMAADAARPYLLQVTAGLLVLSALVLQCLAVGMVASVAWPLEDRASADAAGGPRRLRRLRTGVALTFVAVAVLALGAISTWWPTTEKQEALLRAVTSSGAVCGALVDSGQGAVALDVDGRRLVVALDDVARLEVVDTCT